MEKSPFLIQLISFVHLTVHCLIAPHAPAIYFTPHQILAKMSTDFLMKFSHVLK